MERCLLVALVQTIYTTYGNYSWLPVSTATCQCSVYRKFRNVMQLLLFPSHYLLILG